MQHKLTTDDVVRMVSAIAGSLRETPGQFVSVSMHVESVTGFSVGGEVGGGSVTNYGTMEASPSFSASADAPSNSHDQEKVAKALEYFAEFLKAQPDPSTVATHWDVVRSALPPVLQTTVAELLALTVYHGVVHHLP